MEICIRGFKLSVYLCRKLLGKVGTWCRTFLKNNLRSTLDEVSEWQPVLVRSFPIRSYTANAAESLREMATSWNLQIRRFSQSF